MIKLSLWQKFLLKVSGEVFVGYEICKGWSDCLPMFARKCPDHGLYVGHHYGYSNKPPQCRKCLEKLYQKVSLPKQ